MDKKDLWINDALNSYPLSPVPAGFTQRVMAQVAVTRAPAGRRPPAIAFKLEFLDFAIPAFMAFFVTFTLSVGASALLLADPIKLLRIQLTAKAWLASMPIAWVNTGVVFFMWGFFLLAAGLALGSIFWITPWKTRVELVSSRLPG